MDIMDSKLEIRKLSISVRSKLASILEVNDAWKILMGSIPQSNFGPADSVRRKKYSAEHVRYISLITF